MNDINYTSGGIELLDQITPLWIKLNDWHREHSIHFSHIYQNRTFDDRKKMLSDKLANGQIHIDLAEDATSKKLIGYCVTSIDSQNSGEVDSIYVEASYRNQGIATKLMQRALAWLDQNNVEQRTICVAAGNETVFPFYEQFGFYPSNHSLKYKNSK